MKKVTLDMYKDFIGKKVLIRTYSAGIHFGTLEAQEGKALLLSNARRIWSWKGALSLNEIAKLGLDLDKSKITVNLGEIIIPSHIELMPITSHLADDKVMAENFGE